MDSIRAAIIGNKKETDGLRTTVREVHSLLSNSWPQPQTIFLEVPAKSLAAPPLPLVPISVAAAAAPAEAPAVTAPLVQAPPDFAQICLDKFGPDFPSIKRAFPHLSGMSDEDAFVFMRSFFPQNWAHASYVQNDSKAISGAFEMEGVTVVVRGHEGILVRFLDGREPQSVPVSTVFSAILHNGDLIIATPDSVQIYDVATQSTRAIPTKGVHHVAASKLYLACATPREIQIYERATGKLLVSHRISSVTDLDLSESGMLAVGCEQGVMMVMKSCLDLSHVQINAHDPTQPISHVKISGNDILSASGIFLKLWKNANEFTAPFSMAGHVVHSAQHTNNPVIGIQVVNVGGQTYYLTMGTHVGVRNSELTRIYELPITNEPGAQFMATPYCVMGVSDVSAHFIDFTQAYSGDNRPSTAGNLVNKTTDGLKSLGASAASGVLSFGASAASALAALVKPKADKGESAKVDDGNV